MKTSVMIRLYTNMLLSMLLLAITLTFVSSANAQDLPEVKATNIRQVYHNGEHNAFTDLVQWRDKFWLTFRSCPDGHMVHPTSRIIVLSSEDRKDWKEEHHFSVPLRDTRDPHFLIFKEQLFIYTGTWYSGETTLPRDQYDVNKHLGYADWTADGTTWQGPRQLEGTYGHYIWRAAAMGDTAYLCGRRNRDHVQVQGERDVIESAMLKSDDGLIWRFHSFFQETRGDETAFQFDAEGNVLAVGRRGSAPAQLLKSAPPYTEWERKDLTEYVGGPLVTRWGDHWVVAGRRNTKDGAKTVFYWLVDDTLHPFVQLPSGGDNSYPGLIELSPTHAVVSWYSSHEKDAEGKTITAIYMADLVIDE